jgi:beta-ureidopropionase
MVLIAAGQLSSTSSLTKNGAIAVRLIERAVRAQAKVLFLPEASDYIAKSQEFSKKLAVTVDKSPFVHAISSKLKQLYDEGIHIEVNVGVHEPSTKSDRVLNTSLWFNSQGEIVQRYQKIHLFDVEIPGGAIMKESQGVEPGNEVLQPFTTSCGHVGLAICYDLRFPELALRLRSLGADIIAFPSAFTMRTGAAHWHLLGRSRAIDTQCYVVMAAQSGGHVTLTDEDLEQGLEAQAPTRFSYGHTVIIDPWGTVVAEVSDVDVQGEGVCIADVDLDLVNKVRTNMPLWEQRRPDVFDYDV